MTQDEMLSMAREAGFGPAVEWTEMQPPFLRFAALVAAAEREACARICDRNNMSAWGFARAIRSRGTNAN